ncbi:hypothetical protein LX32DRAFT_636844 [Colletotrichum zoysiae]|uniref:Uncharacterized protein n=1 Tax=Colletotrichum zoysiae TaxID=1216348 RepID=A0AAD9M3I8_9PEZI|nr:hypothetical protein LX32DRAFT_636844 [Colletotrichum zoysiae]
MRGLDCAKAPALILRVLCSAEYVRGARGLSRRPRPQPLLSEFEDEPQMEPELQQDPSSYGSDAQRSVEAAQAVPGGGDGAILRSATD